MSLLVPKSGESVIVRDAEAEVVGRAPVTVKLLADSGSTGGALSTQRVTLTGGADGAKPHWHGKSAEMFFLLDGAAEILSGDQVVTAGPGDLVVPPGTSCTTTTSRRARCGTREAGDRGPGETV